MSACQYVADIDGRIFLDFGDEKRLAARAAPLDAPIAAELLNRARYANNEKRQYTKAARLIARVEALGTFRWEALA